MELAHSIKNKSLFVMGSVTVGVAVFLLTKLVLADSTSGLLPSSEGSYLGWTPKTGSTHYTMVDESSCNGTTDYNYVNTVGSRDSYGVSLASVPNGSTITSVAISPCASRDQKGGGSATMNVFYRYNGVNSSDAGSYALAGITPIQLTTTTFSGLSLTKDSSSTLQIGAVLSAGTRGARLSRVQAVVTYALPVIPTVTTSAATNITASSSVLNGLANPNGSDATGWFRYSTSTPGTCNDVFGIRTPEVGGTSLGSGVSPVAYSSPAEYLSSGIVYYYCAISSNGGGKGFGSVMSFTAL